MSNKIKVIGKAQNGVALGIVKAYTTIYPKATLGELRRVFSNNLAPDNGVDELLLPLAEAEARNTDKVSLYFTKDERPLRLADGTTVALAQIWTASSLERLTQVAANYGIVVELDKSTTRDVRNGYALEFLGGWQPQQPSAPAKKSWGTYLTYTLIVLAIAAAALLVTNYFLK